jgi:hypothetical protein
LSKVTQHTVKQPTQAIYAIPLNYRVTIQWNPLIHVCGGKLQDPPPPCGCLKPQLVLNIINILFFTIPMTEFNF